MSVVVQLLLLQQEDEADRVLHLPRQQVSGFVLDGSGLSAVAVVVVIVFVLDSLRVLLRLGGQQKSVVRCYFHFSNGVVIYMRLGPCCITLASSHRIVLLLLTGWRKVKLRAKYLKRITSGGGVEVLFVNTTLLQNVEERGGIFI